VSNIHPDTMILVDPDTGTQSLLANGDGCFLIFVWRLKRPGFS